MATARHPKATFFVQRHLFAGLTCFAELESRIIALPDEQSRGAAFEVFAEAYLATQRKHDAAQVWPHNTVPLDILKNLGLTQQDQGVDGVLQTLLGQFNAYQIKFRTGRPALTWRELSTFIGLADSPHIHSRVLLTNCDELPAVLNDRQGFFCIRGSDLDRLEAGDFRAMEAWLADTAFIAPKKSPQPHQTEALNALLPALQNEPRVSAIMACGTGKTLVALWIAEHVAQAFGSREATPRKLASHEVAGDAPANFPRPEGTPDFHRPVRTDSVLGDGPDTSCLANFQSPVGTCKAQFGKGKIVKMLGNSMVIRANSPLFATVFLLLSLTISLTVAVPKMVRFARMLLALSGGQNISGKVRAILAAGVGGMTAERVKPAARMLPDAAPLIPMKAQRPKHLCQHRLPCR